MSFSMEGANIFILLIRFSHFFFSLIIGALRHWLNSLLSHLFDTGVLVSPNCIHRDKTMHSISSCLVFRYLFVYFLWFIPKITIRCFKFKNWCTSWVRIHNLTIASRVSCHSITNPSNIVLHMASLWQLRVVRLSSCKNWIVQLLHLEFVTSSPM